MRRYWLESEAFSQLSQLGQVSIEGDSFKHIIGVCRMKEGSRFEVLGYQDKALLVELKGIERKRATATLIEERSIPAIKLPFVYLIMSLPKFEVLENVVEKAVELGVKELHVVDSDYSFVKSKNRDLNKKITRWEKIVKSATQQSGRSELMPLHIGQSLRDIVELRAKRPNSLHIFAYEGESSVSLKEGLGAGEEIKEIYIYLGPEGGFSRDEVEFFAENGIKALTLGDQVLRVETAAISLIASVKLQFELFS